MEVDSGNDGQLDPAFLRQIQLTIDFGRGKAWAEFDDDKSR